MKQQLDKISQPETLMHCHGLRYEATRLHQKMGGVISVFERDGKKEVVLCSNDIAASGYDLHLIDGYKYGVWVYNGSQTSREVQQVFGFKLLDPIPKSSLESQVSILKAAFEQNEVLTVREMFNLLGLGSPTKIVSRLTANGAYPLKREWKDVPNRQGGISRIMTYQKASV